MGEKAASDDEEKNGEEEGEEVEGDKGIVEVR